ncbi:MAG: hypothetical protein Q8O67_24075 [Deltaproteobacteria bacterium]|nr:hypothetical protein [Deltaproteobacteria bacterium]
MTLSSRVPGLLVLPLLLALGGVACDAGGAAEGEGEGEGGPSAQELADAFVDFLDNCGEVEASPLERLEPELFASSGSNQEQGDAVRELLEATFDNPDITVNETAYDACLVALRTCGDLNSGSSACNDIFEGERPVGAGCVDQNVCQPDLQCAQADFDECGTCFATPGLGASCDADPSPDEVLELDCGEGNLCSEAGTCVARNLGLGAPCDIDGDDLCAGDTFCDFADGAADATCLADDEPEDGFVVGDPCVDTCGGRFSGLACVDETCVAAVPVQPGAPCDTGFGGEIVNYCINQLAGINVCFDAEFDDVGVCTTVPSTGPCLDGRCADDTVCNEAETCVALPVGGQPCIDFDCADGFACDDTPDPAVCVALPGAGQPCVDFDCAEDLQCNDVTEICEADVDLVCPA